MASSTITSRSLASSSWFFFFFAPLFRDPASAECQLLMSIALMSTSPMRTPRSSATLRPTKDSPIGQRDWYFISEQRLRSVSATLRQQNAFSVNFPYVIFSNVNSWLMQDPASDETLANRAERRVFYCRTTSASTAPLLLVLLHFRSALARPCVRRNISPQGN